MSIMLSQQAIHDEGVLRSSRSTVVGNVMIKVERRIVTMFWVLEANHQQSWP